MGSWQELELPQYKGAPGWEFTPLSKFDLGAFAAAGDGDLAQADAADLVFDLQAEAVRMTQVDGAWSPSATRRSSGWTATSAPSSR